MTLIDLAGFQGHDVMQRQTTQKRYKMSYIYNGGPMMLQLGHSNKHFKYNINNLVLPNVTEVKDLGIIVDHELKFKRHIHDITTRAHQRASLILRCFKSKDPFLLFKAFVTSVRPLREYNCQVWSTPGV